MPARRKRKPHKIKFYKKNLKLPESQNKLLRQFCKDHQTTENKVFRKALREYLQRNVRLFDHTHYEANPNQLMLFDFQTDENGNTGT